MKSNTLKYIIILFIGLIFNHCDDYLELQPLESPSDQTFFSNETELVLGVNSCYNFRDTWEDRFYRSFCFRWTLVELEDAGQTRMSPDLDKFRDGSASPTWGNIEGYYANIYKGISRCNIVLDNSDRAKESMQSEGKLDLWNRLQSEVRVLRANLYYELVNKFGDARFTDTQLGQVEYKNLPRTEEDEIYEFIFKEIDEAAPFLPDRYEGEDYGRVTSGTAYAIGAKAALFRAFFKDGKAISPEVSYLEKVRDYTENVIQSGVYDLYYDPENPEESYKSLFTYKGENSNEAIFQREFKRTGDSRTAHFMTNHLGSRNLNQGRASMTPQEYLIHSYEDTLGNPIDESPYYNPKNPFFGRDPRLYQTVILPRVEGDQIIEIILNTEDGPDTLKGFNEVWPGSKYPDYDKGITREYKTLLTAWADKFDLNMNAAGENDGRSLDNWDWWTDANGIDHKISNQDGTNPWSSRTGYLTYKYMTFEDYSTGTFSDPDINMMLIRYADVLLMHAEALIELNQELGRAAELMNMVRARGYGMTMGEYASHPSYISTSDQSELRRYLRRERKIEFCFEGLRYDDLRRYGAAEKALTQDVLGRPKFFHLEAETNIPVIDDNAVVSMPWLDGLDPQSDDYPNRWWIRSDYQQHFNLWPIPQSEFDNGGLDPSEQNPGY